MTRKRILLATKNQNDTTSFLRAMGAFTHTSLKNHVEPIRAPLDPNWVFDWSYYFEIDCIYLHRPSNIYDMQIISRANQIGIPVWVDMDDDLENLTPDNPVFHVYNKKEVKDVIRFAITEADFLSVGGEVHAEKLRQEFKREVHLIPGALDDRLLSLKKPFKYSKTLCWRGSESHRADLIYYSQPIIQAIDDYGLDCKFFGLNPYFLNWEGKRKIQHLGQVNLFDYYIALCANNACFHMHPMIDSWFNRVKSNLCFTDCSLAGSVLIAPDFPEFRRPGIMTFEPDNRYDLALKMQHLFESSEVELAHRHKVSWQWICDNILLSKINKLRLNIIQQL